MFKNEADAEIFCQIVATIASEEEETDEEIKYRLYTTDEEFSKTGNKAIEILNTK
ncbi:hypothetical protein [Pyrococcus kukulkanii]|uniref:hypothetical protein n=1 Tax=Pyrococcus kukulkanii TaxID=1609559 RepID=UPI0035677485